MQCVDEGPEEERDSLHGRRVSQPSRSCRLRGSQCHRGLSSIPGMVGEAFSVALEDQLSLNYSYGFHSVSIELIFYGFFLCFSQSSNSSIKIDEQKFRHNWQLDMI